MAATHPRSLNFPRYLPLEAHVQAAGLGVQSSPLWEGEYGNYNSNRSLNAL